MYGRVQGSPQRQKKNKTTPYRVPACRDWVVGQAWEEHPRHVVPEGPDGRTAGREVAGQPAQVGLQLGEGWGGGGEMVYEVS